MTDYNPDPRPDPRPPRDRYAEKDGITDRYGLNDAPVQSRSNYAFIALLAGVVLVGGFLLFGNQQPTPQQAEVPRTNMDVPLEQPAPAPAAQTPAQNQAPTRLPAAPPEGPIRTPPDSVTPANPQR